MLAQVLHPLHPYETISLSKAGYVLGFALIFFHAIALIAPDQVKAFLKKAPRNETLGQITLAIALFWFFLLIAPDGDGILSSLRVQMAGFERLIPWLQLLTPVVFFLMIFKLKEFLFVRALGVLGLLVVAPFLSAAFLKDPETRLLIPIWCFGVIFMSFFWIGKPYLLRDQVAWITANSSRWNMLAWCGIAYGAAIVICDYLFW